MDKEQKLARAMNSILPKGGWSYAQDKLSFEVGVKVPTKAQIDAQIAKDKANEPIKSQLIKLDNIISRDKEDFANDNQLSLDSVSQAVVIKKIALRGKIK